MTLHAPRYCGLLLVFSLLCACSHTQANYLTHPSLAASAPTQRPNTVALLFGDVRVLELSAGNVPEVVESWSQQAKQNLSAGAQKWVRTQGWQWAEPPTFSAPEKQSLDQHLLLYRLLFDALYAQASPTADPLWQQRARDFDYPLGPGLDFLREKTGADVALIVSGFDQVSSKGRKATMALSAVFGAFSGSYVLPGETVVWAGMIDLQRGVLLWANFEAGRGSRDLRHAADVEAILNALFRDYPQVKVGR